jgi:hypothetical protein
LYAVAEPIGIRKLRQALAGTLRRLRGGDRNGAKALDRPISRFPVSRDQTASAAIEEDRAER